jgi:hypothetical protein
MTIQIDTWDVVRVTIGAAIVVANWVVYRGVKFEESTDSWTKETGKIWLRRGLFAETIFALALLFIDSRISIGQRDEIIGLQQHLTARELSDEQNASALAAISGSPLSIKYAFSLTDDEQAALAIALSQKIFSKAGWEWVNWPARDKELTINLPNRPYVGFVLLNGIQLRILNPALLPVARALERALTDAGLENVRMDQENDARAGFQKPDNPMLMQIMIGTRPTLKPPSD